MPRFGASGRDSGRDSGNDSEDDGMEDAQRAVQRAVCWLRARAQALQCQKCLKRCFRYVTLLCVNGAFNLRMEAAIIFLPCSVAFPIHSYRRCNDHLPNTSKVIRQHC